MIYNHARVSSTGQDLAQRLGKPDATGCTKIYSEQVSAATAGATSATASPNAKLPAGPQANARDVKFGQRAALTSRQQAEALQRLAAGDTQRTVATLLGVDQATISRLHRR